MDTLPPIGSRVRYRRLMSWAGAEPREVVGTVIKHWPGYKSDCDCDDDEPCDHAERPVTIGEPGWTKHWSASVEVHEVPPWWMWGDRKVFAPDIEWLEPE